MSGHLGMVLRTIYRTPPLSTSMALPQKQTDEKKASLLQSKGPPRQEQKESVGESARDSHVGDRLAVLSIKGYPHQIAARDSQALKDKNKKHPCCKYIPSCYMP